MFAALVGLQVAAGLLLRGAWDAWAQALVLLLIIAGAGLGLAVQSAAGRVRLAARGVSLWVGALILLSLASALTSPVPAYALPAWAAAAVGLWLIPAATFLDADDRILVEQAVRVAAWVLTLLAFYQYLHGDARPAAAFPNQNVFAGAILLLLPFAVRRRDPLLVVGLLCALWWTRSVGAWLGLAAALLLGRRAVGSAAAWAGALAGCVGLIAAYAKLESPETLHRWAWWAAAWRMGNSAPLLGLGPGSFAYALPAYVPAGSGLSTLYAHQHFLETFAERGGPYLILWVIGLVVLLVRARPGLRVGLVAALVHGLVDYPLSIPGVFWLFCLSAGWTLPESDEAAPVRGAWRISTAIAALAVAAALGFAVERGWRAERLRARAVDDFALGAPARQIAAELAQSERLRHHPETARFSAELALSRAAAGEEPGRRLVEAAADLELAASLDPYRASNWILLEEVYRRLGRPADAADARRRGALTCPSLRARFS